MKPRNYCTFITSHQSIFWKFQCSWIVALHLRLHFETKLCHNPWQLLTLIRNLHRFVLQFHLKNVGRYVFYLFLTALLQVSKTFFFQVSGWIYISASPLKPFVDHPEDRFQSYFKRPSNSINIFLFLIILMTSRWVHENGFEIFFFLLFLCISFLSCFSLLLSVLVL